jgi:cytoskeletal protein CcmA (bactofilin family)
MWKKEDSKPDGTPSTPATSSNSAPVAASAPASSPANSSAPPTSSRATACISQGIKIKGEVNGSEDLFVDGTVDGKLNLTNGSLTIGPNGQVKADVVAREVIVRGKIEGKVTGRDRVQLWSTGQVAGEVQTDRLAIEDGALLRGKVEAGRQPAKASETKAAAAAASQKGSETTSFSSGSAAN